MTDTTAPRTAAVKAMADAIHAECLRNPNSVTQHSREAHLWASESRLRDLAANGWTLDRAEAIEPLLALVRAAQELVSFDDWTEPLPVAEFDAKWDAREKARAALREAVSGLPESIRAARQ